MKNNKSDWAIKFMEGYGYLSLTMVHGYLVIGMFILTNKSTITGSSSLLVAELFLIGLTIIRCYWFFDFAIKKISEISGIHKNFNWFFMEFLLMFFYLVITFGIDNLFLYKIGHGNFNNINSGNIGEEIFDFIFYSFMNITTVGLSPINAVSRTAQSYLMLEVFMGFLLVGYFLGNFASIKESLNKKSFLGHGKKLKKRSS